MVRIEQYGLGLMAFLFALAALGGLFAPELLFDNIGIAINTPAGAAEIRAINAGLLGGSSFLFAMGAKHESHRDIALVMAVIVLGGFTLGRLVSLVMDGVPEHPIAFAALVVESIGFVVAILLLRHHRKRLVAD